MKVLITIADPREIAAGLPNEDFGFACHLAHLSQPIIVTGIGVKSAGHLNFVLQKEKPDMVVNVGTCVSKEKEVVGTVHYFNKFKTKDKEFATQVANLHVEPDPIFTSEKFIHSDEGLCGCKYGDMEAAHQALICLQNLTPFLAIKVVSDHASETSVETWEAALPMAATRVRDVIQHICQTAQICNRNGL